MANVIAPVRVLIALGIVAALLLWLLYGHLESFCLSPESMASDTLRRAQGESTNSYLGIGRIAPAFLRYNWREAQAVFFARATSLGFRCENMRRMGSRGDGGYEMCNDTDFSPKRNACLVYSFGIKTDWSFDEAMNDNFGCEVHSFDPSTGLDDHTHREPNMFFHNLGLWGHNWQNKEKGWAMRDLSTIIDMLGHNQRTIDVLKIDAEGAEWTTLRHLVDTGVHRQVKQLLMEIHTPYLRKKRNQNEGQELTVLDLGQMWQTFYDLEKAGFVQFFHNTQRSNQGCRKYSKLNDMDFLNSQKQHCCLEMMYVNKNFLK